MRWINLVYLLLIGQLTTAQVLLKGQVRSGEIEVINEEVLNLITEKSVRTDSYGRFEIEVSEGDMLIIASTHFEYYRKRITAEIIAQGKLEIELESKAIELDEVTLTYAINPEDLNIVKKNQKQYTSAEKRLYTASTGIFDRVQKKQMVKVVAAESMLMTRETLLKWFTSDYFTQRLHIPILQLDEFIYYVVEFTEVRNAVKLKDKNRTAFLLSKYAPEFIEQSN